MKRIFLLFLPLLIFSQCSDDPAEKIETVKADTISNVKEKVESFSTGVLVPKVLCKSDPRFSYALYLPKDYTTNRTYPVIIFFDAHASGQLPVEKYLALSDKYGFILAGSNESKNGLEGGIYPDISKAIAGDLNSRFKVQGNRLYLAGFSGGARVAINIGVADETVAGVIANSAGFDPAKSPIKENFVFAGIAGNEDFNWLEQQRTEKNLDILPVRHCFLEFDGKHEWAPLETMEKAFVFLDCSALRKEIKIRNDSAIKAWYEKDKKKLNSMRSEKEMYAARKTFVSFYSGVFETKKEEAELSRLKESKQIKQWLNEHEKAEAREAVLQNEYYQKVFTESAEWWEKEVKRMTSLKKETTEYKLNKRVLSYISLAVYMTIKSPEAQQDMLTLERLIAIYSIVDPGNSEWAYLKAVMRARQGNREEAVNLLLKSFALGFSDKERLRHQQEFSSVISDPKIQDWLFK